ncbi:amidase family protein [Proteinivorax hydrogeniformans]|uniref:Amidase family protein n=1 Tax=Proteinivorax hydrogeniformans TaxID=1826727 RepID=A0AAU8HRX1_9FIRM
MKSNILKQMNKLSKAMLYGNYWKDNIVYHRHDVLDEGVNTLEQNGSCKLRLFGVKDTNQIEDTLVKKLQQKEGFLFHTVDQMSAGGRAIDTDTVNPLTSRVMTGSSSASCANILRGINDLAIGTDGGGSVLAPAISTGLYSIMAKGMGLKGIEKKVSTDNIPFVPGVGIIASHFNVCTEVVAHLLDVSLIDAKKLEKKDVKIAIPRKGDHTLPDGRDMAEALTTIRKLLDSWVTFKEVDLTTIDERKNAIKAAKRLFKNGFDGILTAEGPVDLYGLGDSIVGQWGSLGYALQNNGGKYMVKVANMLNATAISIPAENLSTGFVITVPEGVKQGLVGIALGDLIDKIVERPPLFSRYFFDNYCHNDMGFIR